VLIAGGHLGTPGPSVASAELYDPASESFSATGDMTDLRGSHTATLLTEGTVLIAGGYTAFPETGTTLSSAEIYARSIVDTQPPTITTPDDMTVIATSAEGAVVSYTATATDNIDINPQLACEPPEARCRRVVRAVRRGADDSRGSEHEVAFGGAADEVTT